MSDYVPVYKRDYYIEAFELGHKHGFDKKGPGMSCWYYGRPADDDPDKAKIEAMNFAYLSGWFTGESEWCKQHPDPNIVKYDTPKPLKGGE